MSSRSIVIITAFVICSAASCHWYASDTKGAYNNQDTSKTTSSTGSLPQESGNISPRAVSPLLFSWSEAHPVKNESFASLSDSLRQAIGKSEALMITGQYFAEEENVTPYPDLGLARAHETKALFADYLDTSQVIIGSQEVAPRSGVEHEPFSSVSFSTVPVISEDTQ